MAKEKAKLSALDRAIQTALGQGRKVGLEEDPAREAYPTVWDWLTRTGDGGDHIFQPATISIQLGPEGVLATITHRDLGYSCSIACPGLADVLLALESALSGPNPPIRNWGKTEPHLRKRRAKS
jgi:hypothetical protein